LELKQKEKREKEEKEERKGDKEGDGSVETGREGEV